jgi:DNA adenine methylase
MVVMQGVMPQHKSFLKWAGGKYRLLDKILPSLPAGKRLIEPFVGSGVVFLNADYPSYLLNDLNTDLIVLYKTLVKQRTSFISYVKTFFTEKNNSEKRYYELREQFNNSTDTLERSALFIYLNRHGFNGLCRYNSKGEFNVPFGRYTKLHFPEAQLLAFATNVLKAKFINQPFEAVFAQAKLGDVIYCDPPYAPLSDAQHFTKYSMREFTQRDQEQLAQLAIEYGNKGIPVIISNHDTSFTRKIYRGAKFKKFTAARRISCDINNRQPAKELLAIFSK